MQVDSAAGCSLTEVTEAASFFCNTPGWWTPCYMKSQTSPVEDQPGLQQDIKKEKLKLGNTLGSDKSSVMVSHRTMLIFFFIQDNFSKKKASVASQHWNILFYNLRALTSL